MSGLSPNKRVLEVATGPGHVAFRFADDCTDATGIDLTKAPLDIAAERKSDQSVDNVEFLQDDDETRPSPDDSFDIVICPYALHHIENTADVLQQMVRVCRPDGTLTLADLVVSERSPRGNSQDTFERLRSPSHVRALPVSDLLRTVSEVGFEMGQDTLIAVLVQQSHRVYSLAAETCHNRRVSTRPPFTFTRKSQQRTPEVLIIRGVTEWTRSS